MRRIFAVVQLAIKILHISEVDITFLYTIQMKITQYEKQDIYIRIIFILADLFANSKTLRSQFKQKFILLTKHTKTTM